MGSGLILPFLLLLQQALATMGPLRITAEVMPPRAATPAHLEGGGGVEKALFMPSMSPRQPGGECA